MKIGYYYGAYDILRAADLRNLDRQIQIQKANGSKLFAVGIYEDGLCQAFGFNKPIKSIEDRMQIMSQMRGVDFVFPISSLDETIISVFFTKILLIHGYLDELKYWKPIS